MFKKAFQIVVTLSLLVAGYTGYTRLFAVVATVLSNGRDSRENLFPESDPTSAQRATELARTSFGPESFAAQKGLKLQYYDKARGYYMYAQNYERLNGGKTLHIWPFAMVWISSDGKSRKTATSDEAWIDMSQPMNLMGKPSTDPNKINHANLVGNVYLRDDKGTLENTLDDLRVGPMTHLEYDESKLQISSDSDILLQDRDLTLTGISMMIQLRRKMTAGSQGGGGVGFEAETMTVYKDVHVMVNNVTSTGILPGAAKPEKTGKTPLDVRSDREMRIVLARPRTDVVGPPDPKQEPDPTLVSFKTNVRVLRGTDQSDRLNCDTLDLTLMPAPKPVKVEKEEGEDEEAPTLVASASASPSTATEESFGTSKGEATPSSSGGMGSDLKLRRAVARGDAVWLQSDAQGMVARCVELIYEKHEADGTPDVTYLNGGYSKKLWVEKVEYDTKSTSPGSIKSIMRLTALDATIFDSGAQGSSTIIARGPGKTEERPSRNASIARTAWFEDEMRMLSWRDTEMATPAMTPIESRAFKFAPPAPAPGTLRRLLTLKGVSKLIDHTSNSTLDARSSIVAEFQALPKAGPKESDGPTQIQWMDAYEDAHVTVPSRTLTAREFLKVKFENPPKPPVVTGPTPSVTGSTLVATNSPPVPPVEEPKSEPKVTPVEPAVDGRANRVWATVLLGSTGTSKGELKNAQLRGAVMVHQDPAPGKAQGSDASGEALDLTSQGLGLMQFIVKAVEPPQAFDPKTKLASDVKARPTIPAVLARVDFEGKTIESVDLIGLDQKADFAFSNGAGIFLQMADRGLLDDKGIEGEGVRVVAKPTGPRPQDRLAITWNEQMRFYGKSRDLEGRPAAKIEFRGTSKEVRSPDGRRESRRGVEAKMTDSAIFCDTMDVYMDRTINFVKAERKSETSSEDSTPADPQIAMLDCRGENLLADGKQIPGVAITSQKLYPGTQDLKEKQRIESVHIIYDKRSGNFYAPGPGTAWLYKRKGEIKPEAKKPAVVPVAAPSTGRHRFESLTPPRLLPPLELTKVKFSEGMRGRFGVAKDQVDNESREAEFIGNAQTVNAIVPRTNSDIDFDQMDRWRDFTFLSSDIIRVYSIPPPVESKAPARQLLNARGNSAARTIDTIIQADRITYDSGQELIYAYGEEGKEVSLSKSESPGQPATSGRGKTLRFNKKTHESDFTDPQALQWTDLKSGFRPKPFFPDLGGTPKPAAPFKPPRLGPSEADEELDRTESLLGPVIAGHETRVTPISRSSPS